MKSSKATASAFGWDFQSNAAIILMLRNIKRATEVKVEGENEDIEIKSEDKYLLMSQVKAVMDPQDFTNVKQKLKKGLQTLSDAAKTLEVEKLVYVTNSPNPFNNKETMYMFSSPLNLIPFSELPDSCKQTINNICFDKNYELDTNLLMICVIQFYGEDTVERYKVLLSNTIEFLNSIKATNISAGELLEYWQHSFYINASQKTAVITKKSMIWPIIVLTCDANDNDSYLEDYDKNDTTEILENYKTIINLYTERFEFVSLIISDFIDFKGELNSRENVKKFISEKWYNYKDYFDLRDLDQTILKAIIRLIISKILNCRNVIQNIKKEVNL
ncbi:MAG: hypothetical protein LBD41_04095 [Clostridiales Family XIII bacterium]|jgi:hypothetical protein|nr:hypothetical protein [Clostridiales Family XIII bacterium]